MLTLSPRAGGDTGSGAPLMTTGTGQRTIKAGPTTSRRRPGYSMIFGTRREGCSMIKESPTTYRVGSIGAFADWTKRVVRDPGSAHGAPKKWFDSEETASRVATD